MDYLRNHGLFLYLTMCIYNLSYFMDLLIIVLESMSKMLITIVIFCSVGLEGLNNICSTYHFLLVLDIVYGLGRV